MPLCVEQYIIQINTSDLQAVLKAVCPIVDDSLVIVNQKFDSCLFKLIGMLA